MKVRGKGTYRKIEVGGKKKLKSNGKRKKKRRISNISNIDTNIGNYSSIINKSTTWNSNIVIVLTLVVVVLVQQNLYHRTKSLLSKKNC